MLIDAPHHHRWTPLSMYGPGIYLHENFILVIERLPVFPVVEGRHPHYLLLLVDNGHGENVLYHPPRIIQGPLLQGSEREGLFQVWSGKAWCLGWWW